MQRRLHARVRLRLPVRLRWAAPLGQKSEICETRNVSRGGLLVACQENHGTGFPLWVTFPFDPAAPDGQPEVLARVLRTNPLSEGAETRTGIALHFESVPQQPSSSNGHSEKSAQANDGGRSLALPIRVRQQNVPWFEESMTVEVSPDKLRFLSNREYLPGETLLITFASRDVKPWNGTGEVAAKIVNVERLPHSRSLVITLKRLTD